MKSAREVVELLQLYRGHVTKVLGVEPETVSNAYSFIVVVAPEMQIQFEVSGTSAKLYKASGVSAEVEAKIKAATWPTSGSTDEHNLPDHVYKNLSTADSIANLASNCTMGDDYSPGNFSKVILSKSHIELQQVNYMNAKSLDHKNNYSLRSLVFRIPLDERSKMITEFTDRSSENNRHCGERIQAALDWLPD
jgi:hypothetical protein